MDKYGALKQYFGYTEFRPGQAEVIDAILAGRDVLAVMPTGAGKSLCYQIPALLLEGLTVVISPLISLMKDQVEALKSSGVHAACVNSSLGPAEYADTMGRAFRGEYTILYIAPERLQRDDIRQLCTQLTVSLVVIDEAHCISQWGHDFRPSYFLITDFVRSLSKRPVTAAFTATATGRVKEDIAARLKLKKPFEISTGFDRKNLYFAVERPADKDAAVLAYARLHADKSGIVYCATRKAVDELFRFLDGRDVPVTRYHAGLADDERRRNQDDFIYDRKPVMVATNAFGMGIDKSNVSYVIHYNMPKNIESYYQEAGRAGRDGTRAECILMYSPQDVRINSFLIKNGGDEVRDQLIVEHNLELLKQMTFYATSSDCLRARLLGYFGEEAPAYCGNCSACNTQYDEIDITVAARKIISCVYRLEERGRRYGKTMVIDILRGGKTKKITGAGLDTLSTWGIMADTDARRLRLMIDHLVKAGYLAVEGDEYPVLVLGLNGRAETWREPFVEDARLTMMLPPEQQERPQRTFGITQADGTPETAGDGHIAAADNADSEQLFLRLRELRGRLAKEAHVPAYVIFSDATLQDMCRKRPRDDDEFLAVNGVGQKKLALYGGIFMDAIRAG